MQKNKTTVKVYELPRCQFPHPEFSANPYAKYDARISLNGSWAYVCQRHFETFQCQLGTGKGQELILVTTNQKGVDE